VTGFPKPKSQQLAGMTVLIAAAYRLSPFMATGVVLATFDANCEKPE
jgi:hypothetical protein